MPRHRKTPTRAEQLPHLADMLQNCRDDYAAPTGRWFIDEAITKMADRGLCRASAVIAPCGRPHISIRYQAMLAVKNAFTAASSVYTGRENKRDREKKQKIVDDLDLALAAFLRAFDGELIEPMRSAVTDARAVRNATKDYLTQSVLPGGIGVGSTADFLQVAFAQEMRRLWMDEVHDVPRYPNKGLLVELAVGVWRDAKLPDHDIEAARLHARIKSWLKHK